jgi:hypothetical protein
VKTCPYCRKQIDVAATKCPYCASAFDGHQIEQGRREQSRKNRNTILGVLAVIAGLIWWMTRPDTIAQLADDSARQTIESEQSGK